MLHGQCLRGNVSGWAPLQPLQQILQQEQPTPRKRSTRGNPGQQPACHNARASHRHKHQTLQCQRKQLHTNTHNTNTTPPNNNHIQKQSHTTPKHKQHRARVQHQQQQRRPQPNATIDNRIAKSTTTIPTTSIAHTTTTAAQQYQQAQEHHLALSTHTTSYHLQPHGQRQQQVLPRNGPTNTRRASTTARTHAYTNNGNRTHHHNAQNQSHGCHNQPQHPSTRSSRTTAPAPQHHLQQQKITASPSPYATTITSTTMRATTTSQ